MQSAETISAAYDFDLAARDYTLADSAIELVIERPPCSALIKAAQSRELIFCGQSDSLRGGRHLPMVANFVAICKNTAEAR